MARAVASAVAKIPGVVRLHRPVTTAPLAVVSAVTDALGRWGRHSSRARAAACCGVRVRVVGDRAEVALDLCIDPSVVAVPDYLHAAAAVASGVQDCVASVVREAGWQCRDVDITVHALEEATPGHGHARSGPDRQ